MHSAIFIYDNMPADNRRLYGCIFIDILIVFGDANFYKNKKGVIVWYNRNHLCTSLSKSSMSVMRSCLSPRRSYTSRSTVLYASTVMFSVFWVCPPR